MSKQSTSKNVKQAVASGLLCYICEVAAPTEDDDIGGRLCAACKAGIVAMVAKYHRQPEGYHEVRRHQDGEV